MTGLALTLAAALVLVPTHLQLQVAVPSLSGWRASALSRSKKRVMGCLIRLPSAERPIELGERPFLKSLGVNSSAVIGDLIFAGVALIVAEAPRALHALYEGPIRLGPAVLNGGSGAGFSLHW